MNAEVQSPVGAWAYRLAAILLSVGFPVIGSFLGVLLGERVMGNKEPLFEVTMGSAFGAFIMVLSWIAALLIPGTKAWLKGGLVAVFGLLSIGVLMCLVAGFIGP